MLFRWWSRLRMHYAALQRRPTFTSVQKNYTTITWLLEVRGVVAHNGLRSDSIRILYGRFKTSDSRGREGTLLKHRTIYNCYLLVSLPATVTLWFSWAIIVCDFSVQNAVYAMTILSVGPRCKINMVRLMPISLICMEMVRYIISLKETFGLETIPQWPRSCWGSCCYQIFDLLGLRLCRFSTDRKENFHTY